MKKKLPAGRNHAIASDNAKPGKCEELLDALKFSVVDQSSIAQDTPMLLTIIRHHYLYLSGELACLDKGIEAAISTWGLDDRIDMMKGIYKGFYDRHHSLSSCHVLRSEASGEESGPSPVMSSSLLAPDQGGGLSFTDWPMSLQKAVDMLGGPGAREILGVGEGSDISARGLDDRIDMHSYDTHHSLSSCRVLRSEASVEESGLSPVKSSSSSAPDQGFGLSYAELKKRVGHTSFTSFDKSQLKHVFMGLSRDSNLDDFSNSKGFVALFTIPGVDSTAMMSQFLDMLKEMSPVDIVRRKMKMPREVSEISDVDMCALGYKEGFLELAGDQRKVFLREDLRLKPHCVVKAFEDQIFVPFRAMCQQASVSAAMVGLPQRAYDSTSVLHAWGSLTTGTGDFGQYSGVFNAAKSEHDSAVVVCRESDAKRVMIERLEDYRVNKNQPGKPFSGRRLLRWGVNKRKNLAVNQLIRCLDFEGGACAPDTALWSEFSNGALLEIGKGFIDNTEMSNLLPDELIKVIEGKCTSVVSSACP